VFSWGKGGFTNLFVHDNVVLYLISSRKKSGGALRDWRTRWQDCWTCWRAAATGGGKGIPSGITSPPSCSFGYESILLFNRLEEREPESREKAESG